MVNWNCYMAVYNLDNLSVYTCTRFYNFLEVCSSAKFYCNIMTEDTNFITIICPHTCFPDLQHHLPEDHLPRVCVWQSLPRGLELEDTERGQRMSGGMSGHQVVSPI